MSSEIDKKGSGKNNNKKKVLIVEDDSIQAYVVSAIVKNNNYDLIGVASTGDKAIELATVHKPNIILMDITLVGEMDGIDVAGIIMKAIETKIIYITGNTGSHHLKKAEQTGYVEFLKKPIHNKLLKYALKKASK